LGIKFLQLYFGKFKKTSPDIPEKFSGLCNQIFRLFG